MSKTVTFPIDALDQEVIWYLDGDPRFIVGLTEDEIIDEIDLALANASTFRMAWSIKNRALYDEGERARRWILSRKAVRALLRRLVTIELEIDETAD